MMTAIPIFFVFDKPYTHFSSKAFFSIFTFEKNLNFCSENWLHLLSSLWLISWLIMVIIDMYSKNVKKLLKYFLFHLGLYYDQTFSSWGSQTTLWLSGCSHFCVMSLCIDRQNHPCIQVKKSIARKKSFDGCFSSTFHNFSSVYLTLKCLKLAHFIDKFCNTWN